MRLMDTPRTSALYRDSSTSFAFSGRTIPTTSFTTGRAYPERAHRVPRMSSQPAITLHSLPPSHPSRAVEAAIRLKGLEYEVVTVGPGVHTEQMDSIYGAGRRTVPGVLIDDEPVHGSRAIMARLEELVAEPPLFPADLADDVREAERWRDEEFQQLGRDLGWGALHFRPESLGTMAGG